MKRIIALASIVFATVCTQAQLSVTPDGYATTSNITTTGKTGIGYSGVLTVTTNIVSNSFNSLSCGPKTIICAKSNLGANPFLAYNHSSLQPIFYVDYLGWG